MLRKKQRRKQMALLDIFIMLLLILGTALYLIIITLGVIRLANIIDERIHKEIMEDDKEIKVAKVNTYCGEMYARCPHCDMENAMVGMIPVEKRKGYQVYSCERCGGLFRVG